MPVIKTEGTSGPPFGKKVGLQDWSRSPYPTFSACDSILRPDDAATGRVGLNQYQTDVNARC